MEHLGCESKPKTNKETKMSVPNPAGYASHITLSSPPQSTYTRPHCTRYTDTLHRIHQEIPHQSGPCGLRWYHPNPHTPPDTQASHIMKCQTGDDLVMPVKSFTDDVFALFGAEKVDHRHVAVSSLQHVHVAVIYRSGRLIAARHPDFVRPDLDARLIPKERNRAPDL